MVDYRRMGNMEQHLGSGTSTTLLHQLRDLWKSPRGTVLRIEVLALVAIAFSFLLAAFGSCRCWSNRWIIQKGFLAANVLSLSLGTYSIGLMQSSSVKSEMYPIWAVSLLTLFGCVDPVSSYSGLDYKSPLSKMVFQLCLYCGYVVWMSISTISSDVGNVGIILLSAITFIKGFHRSLAFVLPRRMRKRVQSLCNGYKPNVLAHGTQELKHLIVHLPLDLINPDKISMDDIYSSCKYKSELQSDVRACHDVCLAFSMSHLLQQRFLGLYDTEGYDASLGDRVIDYQRAFQLIEIELAFLYEVYFTSNAFLHYYQSKVASLWAFTSFIGICFIGVTSVIPGTMTSQHTTSPGPGVSTIVVDTTTADRIVTLVILVSLALLQLLQLIRSWTSNWARVAFACEYTRNRKLRSQTWQPKNWWLWRMRLKAFLLTRMNWFDNYLWQDKLGQCSVLNWSCLRDFNTFCISSDDSNRVSCWGRRVHKKIAHLHGMLGFQYSGRVLWELFGSGTKEEAAVRLDYDVKASIVEFLCLIGGKGVVPSRSWSSGSVDLSEFPYINDYNSSKMSDAAMFSTCAMVYHIATCYCELAESEQERQNALLRQAEERTGFRETIASAVAAAIARCNKRKGTGTGEAKKNRRVAVALSKYCAYLMVSAPELLPGPSMHVESAYRETAREAWKALHGTKGAKGKLDALKENPGGVSYIHRSIFWEGVSLGKLLVGETSDPDGTCCSDPWNVLARFWVQALVYAAPYGNPEAHLQHLSQGGELITHLWALLYHAGIREWKPAERGEENLEERGDEFDSENKRDDGGQTKVDFRVAKEVSSDGKLCRSRSF